MALVGCGGGSGGGHPDTTEPPPAPQLRISAAADDTGRAPNGMVHLHRIELRNTGNAAARAVTVSTSLDAQALQMPLSCETAGCTARGDGGVDIAEIPAGSTVVLRQQLRVKPGYRGAVRNDWQASATGASASWRQELTAYVTDLKVTVAAPTGTPAARNYEVTLTNQGPDEATAVSWNLLTLSGQAWRITGCTASTGSACPATLGEAMTLARLPASGTLKLQVQMDESASPGPSMNGLGSRADADGDPAPQDNEAKTGQDHSEHQFMTDLAGHNYRLAIGIDPRLRATAPGVDYRATYAMDVTGQAFIGDSAAIDPPWGRGTVNHFGPFEVLGLDIDGTRKLYIAPHRLISQLSELEGVTFNVLGSRADASGKALDAYAGSARFKDGALQLCLPDAPVAFDQCPAARLTRFEAAWVGSEIELVSRDKVIRLRAAKSNEGPILISSSRDAATGASEFWLGLPNNAPYPFSGNNVNMLESTFESASGLSTAVYVDIDTDSERNPRLRSQSIGLPNTALLRLNKTGLLGICGLSAQASTTAQPGLFQAQLHGDWLPGAMQNGQFVKEKPCFATGPVLHAQTTSMAVFVGARSGDLMGRWMFAGQ